MVNHAVQALLSVPENGGPAGRARTLIAPGDIVPQHAEIAAARKALQERDIARVIGLAEARLSGERRNDTLRLLAQGAAVHPQTRTEAIALLERRLEAGGTPVVAAALYLVARERDGTAPRLELVSPLVWTAALRWLFDYCEPEALHAMADALVRKHPEQRFAARLRDAAALVPPRLPGDRFVDRLDACAQLWRSPDPSPRGLLVCVCGYHGRMGVTLNFIHRWAQRLPWHVLYLRDLAQTHYRHGLAPFGRSFGDLVDGIRSVADGLGVSDVAVYGSSMGGLVAIRAGQALGATRILSAAGTADVAPREDGRPLTPEQKIAVTRAEAPELAAWLKALPRRSPTIYLYGDSNERDSIVGTALAGIDRIVPLALDDLNRHNIDFHLVMTGHYDRAFAWLAGQSDVLRFDG